MNQFRSGFDRRIGEFDLRKANEEGATLPHLVVVTIRLLLIF